VAGAQQNMNPFFSSVPPSNKATAPPAHIAEPDELAAI
jgi:hypothetical protein